MNSTMAADEISSTEERALEFGDEDMPVHV